jgi:putative flippase GtrA
MTDNAGRPHSATRGLKHWLGFLGSGTMAFVVDVGVLKLLTLVAGWAPLPSRIISIFVATIAGWLAHRTFTFAVAAKPSLSEFIKYLGVASSSAAINFAIFALVLFVRPQTDSALATFISSGCAMVASYLGMRFGAFKQR